MQLTIDTQKDSHAEIRQAIKLLMSLVSDREVYTNEEPKDSIFSNEKSPAADAFADMFGSAGKDSCSELNVPKEEKKKKLGGIELY